MLMLPEELVREKIDKQLKRAGWDIVSRDEYTPNTTSAVKEALMQGNTESDYLLFVDNKAIAVVGRVCSPGSIMQVCIGGSIGKCAITDKETAFNQQINSLSPIMGDSKYLYYVLCSGCFLE